MTDVRLVTPMPVLRALQSIERLRVVDMYDRETVLMFMDALGHERAAAWLARNRHLYFRALFRARATPAGAPVSVAFAGPERAREPMTALSR